MAPEHETELRTPGAPAPGASGADDQAQPQSTPTTADPERPHGDPLSDDIAETETPPASAPDAADAPQAPDAPPPGSEAASQPGPAPGPETAEQPAHGTDPTQDLEGLSARAQKADEYLELAQRTKADFENYRRRAVREAAAAQERGIAKLAKELLPAVDNLDLALEAAQAHSVAGQADAGNGDASLISGIKLVHADVIAALQRAGIERFSPQGEPFDPQYHEAMAQQPVEGAASGTVVEVYQRGYRIGDSVLRPARVVVAQ